MAATGELGSIENSLRHAGHLVQLAPMSFRKVLPPILDQHGFEALLEGGDLDTAARQLFAPSMDVRIAPGDEGSSVRAQVSCALLRRVVDGTGETPAGAILSAWANWLVSLRLAFGTALDEALIESGAGPMPGCGNSCPG